MKTPAMKTPSVKTPPAKPPVSRQPGGSAPLTHEQLEALRRLDACTLANSIETFNERLRNEGFVDNTVRSLFPELDPMVGYAATLRVRGSAPPTADGPYSDRTDWWDYVESLPAPRVLVVEDVATRPGLCSLVGEVHMNILRALRCVGLVTNGSARDIPAARSAGFHYFTGGISVSHGYVHVVDFGHPVEIGGLTIHSGELLHGDLHGVQSVPLPIAARIPEAAARLVAREQGLIALCRAPGFTLAKLRAALAQNRS
jgi:4-hydroxy-4-methyl-2-oxoglutarate aldolase